MTIHAALDPKPLDPAMNGILKLAVLAVGGQGGGVLTSWIEALGRANGYAVQATSVAGVAQRTGATVYYVEMCRMSARQPVFSLMPSAGDVDIMITAELMEAGRAILRGFVTPDRTVLITSTHRALAVSEKMVPGNGIASSAEVLAGAEIAARRLINADFDALATAAGSVISASLFGALAASGALPFDRAAFEATIRAGGKGIEASLRAFAAGFDAGGAPLAVVPVVTSAQPAGPLGPRKLADGWAALVARSGQMPQPVAEMALVGLRKIVDFQDIAYGAAYLDHLDAILAKDTAAKNHALTAACAKYIANAMAYDDVIRVADLKTRASRAVRIRGEMGAGPDNLLQITEYMHPRAAEIAGLLPARLGQKVSDSPKWMARLDRWFNKGRRYRSDGLRAYLMLYFVAGLKRRRLGMYRHAQEAAHLTEWLQTALIYHAYNYDLAVEVIKCRRLIKGYSDTHARGQLKFDRVLAGIALIATRDDAADWAIRLREAALKDEAGKALDGALQTIRSFA